MWLAKDPMESGLGELLTSLVLVDEVYHRVLNDYTCAVAALRLAAKRVSDPAAQGVVMEVAESLMKRAEAHRILQPPRCEMQLDLGDYLQDVCGAISAASLAGAGIRLTLVHENLLLPADRCWCLGLIIAELVTNAARHGLGWSAGDIRVEMLVDAGAVCCKVADNGRSASLPMAGRGQRIISSLIRRYGGRAEWLFGETGASVTVQMPRGATAAR